MFLSTIYMLLSTPLTILYINFAVTKLLFIIPNI